MSRPPFRDRHRGDKRDICRGFMSQLVGHGAGPREKIPRTVARKGGALSWFHT
jgi:hypothetical protein